MTAILAMFANDGYSADEALVTRMLGRMGSRGGARASVWREGGTVIAISRHEWEFGPGFSGPVLIVQDGDHVIAADASLYYRDDLRRKLAAKGVRPKGQTPSHLILAAYQAFGEKCPEMLEGDFSFIIWDRKARRVIAARDFMGRRPVFFANLNGTLIVASAIGAILEHPRCSHELNLSSIAETMAGHVSSSEETSYQSISRLHAGHTLLREGRSHPRTLVHWQAPNFFTGSPLSFDDAAVRLREMLSAAVSERLAHTGNSAVWMSGGRDSTAIFAAGSQAIRDSSLACNLRPVSISYPVGDAGREDETIKAVAAHWGSSVQWLSISDIPLLDMPRERAERRDEPFAHAFESAFRALASATSAIDTHVALDGLGGDQLFLLSPIHLADLFRNGNWLSLARQWKADKFKKHDLSTFVRWAIQPTLPTSILVGARRLRHGRPLESWLRRCLPDWITPAFAQQYGRPEYMRLAAERRRGEVVASTESRWYFTEPFFPRVFSLGAECALEHGVEIRSPLYDRRIIEFAATRPISDHLAGTERKRLLRHAMRDLLPPDVLAPRDKRTGSAQHYSGNSVRRALAAPFNVQFPSSALETLGLIDVPAFEQARLKFVRYGTPKLTLPLLLTLHTEHWLRARENRASEVHDSRRHEREVMSTATCSASTRITSNSPEEFVPPFI